MEQLIHPCYVVRGWVRCICRCPATIEDECVRRRPSLNKSPTQMHGRARSAEKEDLSRPSCFRHRRQILTPHGLLFTATRARLCVSLLMYSARVFVEFQNDLLQKDDKIRWALVSVRSQGEVRCSRFNFPEKFQPFLGKLLTKWNREYIIATSQKEILRSARRRM